jgi:hypothetical protein
MAIAANLVLIALNIAAATFYFWCMVRSRSISMVEHDETMAAIDTKLAEQEAQLRPAAAHHAARTDR